MSTLRISNIEAKADSSSPTVDEQLKFTNSDGDLMLYLDGRTAGITTVGINTTNQTIKFDANNNVMITGIVTATEFHGSLAVGTSVTYGDNEKAYFGTGLDMSIFHNGSNNYIDVVGNGHLYIRPKANFYIQDYTNGEVWIDGALNGGVQLYNNGLLKLATDGNGITVHGNINMATDSTLQLGVGNDFKLFHNGTTNYIRSANGTIQIDNNSGVPNAQFIPGQGTRLYYGSSVKFTTETSGVNITGIVTATSADINGDLDVDGHTELDNVSTAGITTMAGSGNTPQTNSWATNSRLNLHGSYGGGIAFNDSGNNGFVQYVDGSGVNFHLKNGAVGGTTKSSIRCIKDSNVELYYNGNKKFETTNTGAVVSGIVTATSFSGNHIGISTFNGGSVNGISFPLNVKQNNNDNDYDMGTGIKLQGGSDTEFYKWCAIVARGDNNGVGGYSNSQALAFYTYNNNGASGGTEKLRIDSSGRLIVGGGTHAGGTQVVIKGGGVNTYSTLGMYSNHTNPAADTLLSQIRFGSNATADGADIRAYADAAWGTNDYPTRLGFYTAPDGSNSRTEKLRIASTGMITLGNPTSGILKAEINNSVSGHYFVSQCDDNQNGFEIYQQHGSTATRNTFAVYDNRRGSKAESLLIRGDGVKITRSRGGNYARTYEFNYNDGAGGGVQTKNLATVANYNDTCSAVAEVTYVGVYGTANDYISSGHWICGVRRANSGSAWNQTAVEAAAGGNSGTSSLDLYWSSGQLYAQTVGPWMGWTVNVRITIINGDITVNV